MDHICYFIEHEQDRVAFTGNCLLSSGSGRIIKESPENMRQWMTPKLISATDILKLHIALSKAKCTIPATTVTIEEWTLGFYCNQQCESKICFSGLISVLNNGKVQPKS